jgi:hypothetical protein
VLQKKKIGLDKPEISVGTSGSLCGWQKPSWDIFFVGEVDNVAG